MNDDVRPSDLRSLERRIATWMADVAVDTDVGAELDQILNATSSKRPEPRWLAFLKEPPMRLSSGPPVAVGMPARRLVLVFIVIGLLAVVAGGAIVGARLLSAVPPVTAPPASDAPASGFVAAGPQLAWKSTGPGEEFVPGSNMAFDPLSSIPLGIIIFDEQLHETTVGITVSLLALGVTLFGLVLLARAKGAGPPVAARLQPAPAAG